MPGFTSRADLITEAITNGKRDIFNFTKLATTANEAASIWTTLWTGTGFPFPGANPAGTPGTVYDADQSTAVTGAIWFPDRSTDRKYLLMLELMTMSTTETMLMVYDRLVGVGGISLTGTGNQTINSSALSRYTGTDATLNEVWLEVTTATTVTAPIVDLNSYTSADGTTGVAGGSVTFPAVATNLGTMIQMPLDASKPGVRSVEVGLNVSTAATAGAVNLLILRPLVRVTLGRDGSGNGRETVVNYLDQIMMLPRIFDNAVLAFAINGNSTASLGVQGAMTVVYG